MYTSSQAPLTFEFLRNLIDLWPFSWNKFTLNWFSWPLTLFLWPSVILTWSQTHLISLELPLSRTCYNINAIGLCNNTIVVYYVCLFTWALTLFLNLVDPLFILVFIFIPILVYLKLTYCITHLFLKIENVTHLQTRTSTIF